MARVEISPDWRGAVTPMWQEFAAERLGPEVADDMRKACPVETGALKASIEDHLEEDDLIVSASGGGEDQNGNLFVSRRPGKVSVNGSTHPGPGRNVGELVTREVHHVEEGGRAYAAFVTLGHRKFHPSTGQTGPGFVEARPFMQEALFKRRGG